MAGTGNEVTIIVNAEEKVVQKGELSFQDVLNLAYNNAPPQGDNWEFTITYRKGEDKKPVGTLLEGNSVKVKEGMVFNVRATDKS